MFRHFHRKINYYLTGLTRINTFIYFSKYTGLTRINTFIYFPKYSSKDL